MGHGCILQSVTVSPLSLGHRNVRLLPTQRSGAQFGYNKRQRSFVQPLGTPVVPVWREATHKAPPP